MSKYRPGIYAITCKVDGRVYVGQANNMGKRWATHRNDMKEACEAYVPGFVSPHALTHSYQIHGGKENHEFSVLECVDDPKMLIARERHWINKLKTLDPRYGLNKQ
jgi:group I intron endonuclease